MSQLSPAPSTWALGSYLTGLAPEAQQALLSLGARREFRAGRHLLQEGEDSDHIEVLLLGAVKITTIAEDTEALLAIRFAGDIVGETAPLTGQRRTATVTACGDVVARAVSRSDFQRFLENFPQAAIRVAAMISERLQWANTRRADFNSFAAEARIARVLVDLAHRCGRSTPEGVVIDLALSQRELATIVGVGEATAQKAIRELKERGLLDTGYRRLVLRDLAALAAIG